MSMLTTKDKQLHICFDHLDLIHIDKIPLTQDV